MSQIQSNQAVFLRSRKSRYLNTPGGTGPQLVMSPNHLADTFSSDELWWIERVAGPGGISHGDMVFLRSRGSRYLNTPGGSGPQVVMSPNNSADPKSSDEIWWVEKVSGAGGINSNDAIFLRSRQNKYLNTPGGSGPQVVMSPNHSTDSQGSDEMWWIEASPAQVTNNFTFVPQITNADRATLLARHQFAFDRAVLCNRLNADERRKLLSAYTRPIHHDISTNANANAEATINGSTILVNFGNLFPQGPTEIAQTLIHEMMHCAGYTHPNRQSSDTPGDGGAYYGTPPLRSEICIAGSQSLALTDGRQCHCTESGGHFVYGV